jgi:hypothetical protein
MHFRYLNLYPCIMYPIVARGLPLAVPALTTSMRLPTDLHIQPRFRLTLLLYLIPKSGLFSHPKATMASLPLTKPRIRPATLADKDGYVSATRAGYELDHQFQWRYPQRHEFPEDAREGTGVHFDKAMNNDRMTVLVAELPRLENGLEKEDWVVVAGVVWEWKFLEEVEGEVGEFCWKKTYFQRSY